MDIKEIRSTECRKSFYEALAKEFKLPDFEKLQIASMFKKDYEFESGRVLYFGNSNIHRGFARILLNGMGGFQIEVEWDEEKIFVVKIDNPTVDSIEAVLGLGARYAIDGKYYYCWPFETVMATA